MSQGSAGAAAGGDVPAVAQSGDVPAAAQSGGVPAAAGPSAAAETLPLLTVARGEPTAAELAALTVVVDALLRRGSQSSEPEQNAGSRWAAKEQLMRPQLRPGPGAWRASALPE